MHFECTERGNVSARKGAMLQVTIYMKASLVNSY